MQHDDIARVQGGFVFTPVVQYFHVFAQQVAQVRGNGCNVVFRMELAFGRAAQVGHHDNGRAGVQAVFDFAVFERHVHIGADEDGFALHVLFGQFQKCHDVSFVKVGSGVKALIIRRRLKDVKAV